MKRAAAVGLLVSACVLLAPFALAQGLGAPQALTPDVPQVAPRQLVGEPHGQPLGGPALDQRTNEVAALLRCPVCQGLSVADSRSGTAVAMKAVVRDMLAAGYDQEQVLAYFERSYGGFVRLSPPLRGVNWLVWLAPLGGLVLGAFFVARLLRAPAPAGAAPVVDESDDALPQRSTLPDDADLARYVRRVRELAYGWPGGEPPAVGTATSEARASVGDAAKAKAS